MRYISLGTKWSYKTYNWWRNSVAGYWDYWYECQVTFSEFFFTHFTHFFILYLIIIIFYLSLVRIVTNIFIDYFWAILFIYNWK